MGLIYVIQFPMSHSWEGFSYVSLEWSLIVDLLKFIYMGMIYMYFSLKSKTPSDKKMRSVLSHDDGHL